MTYQTFCLTLIILTSTVVTCSYYKADINSKQIVDQYGRISIFHGVNAIFKTFPYYPITAYYDSNSSLCDEDLENLVSWGFNMIRLYIAWEGVEPLQGQYNTTYIEQVRDIVRNCARYNISILLDAHQDVLSRKFCGEGFPRWVFNRTNFPAPWPYDLEFNEEGMPKISDCLKYPFFHYYFTEDVQKALIELYTNQNGIADALGNMWALVASYFKDEPNVIGYELLNEPFGADIYDNPLYFFDSGKNDVDHLAGLYTNLNEKIRSTDNETIIFFEPTVDDFFVVSLKEGPGGPEYNDRQVFSYHVYCPFVDNEGEPKSVMECNYWDNETFKTRVDVANQIGVPGFLTEFGALSNTNRSADEITYVTTLAEKYFNSWSYWQFKYYNDITTAANPGTTESFYFPDGSLQLNKIKALSRPYAYSICGNPVSTNFDITTLLFELTIEANNNCQGMNTELYLSEQFYYPNGTNIVIQNCSDCLLLQIPNTTKHELILPSDWIDGTSLTIQVSSYQY